MQVAEDQAFLDALAPEPSLVVEGDINDAEDGPMFLAVDHNLICDVSSEQAVPILVASFYVFNIAYPKHCYNLYRFFEVSFFKGKQPAKHTTLTAFLAKLSDL